MQQRSFVNYNIRLSSKHHEALRRAAYERRMSMAQIIRIALEKELKIKHK